MGYKERVNELLKERNMSGVIVAGRLGISSAAFYSQLNNPTLQSMERVAGALGVPVYELLREGPGDGGPRFHCPHCGCEIELVVRE